MYKKSKYFYTLYKSTNMDNMLRAAILLRDDLTQNQLKALDIHNYVYTPDEAMRELDLEIDVMDQLIDDYVEQIVKSNMNFLSFIRESEQKKTPDYQPIKDLAHKNLGVAKNLRILDAERILQEIMKEKDIDKIFVYLEALFACVTVLRPKKAFDTLRLIKVKNAL